MFCFNFILCFKLIMIHYHTPKQSEIKFKPRKTIAVVSTHDAKWRNHCLQGNFFNSPLEALSRTNYFRNDLYKNTKINCIRKPFSFNYYIQITHGILKERIRVKCKRRVSKDGRNRTTKIANGKQRRQPAQLAGFASECRGFWRRSQKSLPLRLQRRTPQSEDTYLKAQSK